ncbi:MAG: exodeoxyribonuclease VII large subunit, partial [Clostridia bacterium]|nr:exodeoxyribonuclease VII large subunit [Clostridia bacterium]
DLRAPTPSAAAELAVPDQREIFSRLIKQENVMKNRLLSLYRTEEARFQALQNARVFHRPFWVLLEPRCERVDHAIERLMTDLQAIWSKADGRFSALAAKLDSLSPLKVITRGFAAVERGGKMISGVSDVSDGDRLTLTFHDGAVGCIVTERKENS